MAEWSIALAWKVSVGATLPWVRIPLSPPKKLNTYQYQNAMNVYRVPILKRLIPSIYRRYKLLFNPIVKNFKIDNFKIDLDIRESLERKLFFEKKYEEERLSYLIRKINEDKVNIFVDVGANIGIYSLRVAANAMSIKKIIAFEPLEETFLKLKKI